MRIDDKILTKSYHLVKIKKTGEAGGIPISRVWTAEERTLINDSWCMPKRCLPPRILLYNPRLRTRHFKNVIP